MRRFTVKVTFHDGNEDHSEIMRYEVPVANDREFLKAITGAADMCGRRVSKFRGRRK